MMFEQFDLQAILIPFSAFLAGWLLGRLAGRKNNSVEADPRDTQIRSLQATVRVHKADLTKMKTDGEAAKTGLEDAQKTIDRLQHKLKERRNELDIMKLDRKAAVEKTRELRSELQERAAEFTRARARIKELETEISIVRASSQISAGSGTAG